MTRPCPLCSVNICWIDGILGWTDCVSGTFLFKCLLGHQSILIPLSWKTTFSSGSPRSAVQNKGLLLLFSDGALHQRAWKPVEALKVESSCSKEPVPKKHARRGDAPPYRAGQTHLPAFSVQTGICKPQEVYLHTLIMHSFRVWSDSHIVEKKVKLIRRLNRNDFYVKMNRNWTERGFFLIEFATWGC